MCVPSFFLMNKAARWSDVWGAASCSYSWNAWLLFFILSLSPNQACNNCFWNLLPAEHPSRHTYNSSSEKKKIFTYRKLMTENYFHQHTGQKAMDTYNFQTVICASSLSPGARPRLWPDCPSGRCRILVSRQERVSKVFPKVPRNSGTCAQASLAAVKAVLSAVLNWTKLQPMWKTGAVSHVGDTQLSYWPLKHSLGILPSPPLVNS